MKGTLRSIHHTFSCELILLLSALIDWEKLDFSSLSVLRYFSSDFIFYQRSLITFASYATKGKRSHIMNSSVGYRARFDLFMCFIHFKVIPQLDMIDLLGVFYVQSKKCLTYEFNPKVKVMPFSNLIYCHTNSNRTHCSLLRKLFLGRIELN